MNRLEIYMNGASERLSDGPTLDERKLATLQRTVGSARGYDCPVCNNMDGIPELREDGSFYYRKCVCSDIRKFLTAAEKAGMKQVLEKKNFETFLPETPWQEKMLDACRRYAAAPEGWLVLCGQSGSGKTHLCLAVCIALLQAGKSVRMLSWREFAVEVKGLAGEYDRQKEAKDACWNAEVLFIDDLFKCGGSPTAADLSLAFELINHRYNLGLPTVISTEWSPVRLVALDEATGSRMVEMAGDYLLVIPRDEKKNYRLRGARRNRPEGRKA